MSTDNITLNAWALSVLIRVNPWSIVRGLRWFGVKAGDLPMAFAVESSCRLPTGNVEEPFYLTRNPRVESMSRRKIAEQMVMRETRGAPAGASRRLRKSPDAREITVDRGDQSRFLGLNCPGQAVGLHVTQL